ncbi:MAG: hypothetical protein K9M08_08480 [Pirellula sp.]|nr:hypothetical protein [Pirellula sp.]
MAGQTSSTKFQKGNPGGPGRPKTKNTDYAQLIKDCLTPTAAFQIIDKAIENAKQGDARARAWLFSHVVAPIPKTVLVNEAALDSREAIDSVVAELPPDQIAALDALLSRREAASE